MSLDFQIDATDGMARRGRLTTPHGVVETPAFSVKKSERSGVVRPESTTRQTASLGAILIQLKRPSLRETVRHSTRGSPGVASASSMPTGTPAAALPFPLTMRPSIRESGAN